MSDTPKERVSPHPLADRLVELIDANYNFYIDRWSESVGMDGRFSYVELEALLRETFEGLER